VNYGKIDAALAGALAQDTPATTLPVFVHVVDNLSEAQAAELARLGMPPPAGRKIITADASPELIERLSDATFVNRIALAQKLRPLGENN